MSFQGSFVPPAVANGRPLDGEAINAALVELAAFARALHADVAGPCWIGGMAPTAATVKDGTVPAVTIAKGVCAPVDARVSVAGAHIIDLGVRSRKTQDVTIQLPFGAERLLVATADALSDDLAIIWPAGGGVVIPDGAVAVAYAVTDDEKVTQLTDARTGAWQQHVSPGGSSTQVTSALDPPIPLPDTTIGMLLRAGGAGVLDPADGMLLRFEAAVQNHSGNTAVPYPEVQFIVYARQRAFDDGAPAFGGLFTFGSTQGDATNRIGSATGGPCHVIWQGLFLPTASGFYLLDVRVRAVNAEVSDVVFSASRVAVQRPI